MPATGSRAFTIDENTENENDAEEGEDPEYYLVDSDGAKAKVLLLDDEGRAGSLIPSPTRLT